MTSPTIQRIIIRDRGTGVARVALATPRFSNLLYDFFLKIDCPKICIYCGLPLDEIHSVAPGDKSYGLVDILCRTAKNSLKRIFFSNFFSWLFCRWLFFGKKSIESYLFYVDSQEGWVLSNVYFTTQLYYVSIRVNKTPPALYKILEEEYQIN